MKKEEQLREEQEELFFKMMFASFDKTDAPKYEALNEQLKKDPANQETEEETQAMLDFISREIKKRDEEAARSSQRKPGRRFSSTLIKVAVIAAILMLMTVGAYAAIPSFRTMALNFLLQASGDATRIEITDSSERSDRNEQIDGSGIVLLGYHFPGVPDGFKKDDELYDENRAWVFYSSDDGRSIKYQVYHGIERDVAHDTEDANAKKVLIHEHEGLLSNENNDTAISWYDNELKVYFNIEAKGFDTAFAYDLATKVKRVE